ncbi:MAG: hypothetical protein QXL22_01155 [Candidatus Nezhaarchaeales archaeon]
MSWVFQTPERATLEDFEKVLKYHGLTKEEAGLHFIRWVESIRLEDPAVYEMLVRDPPRMSNLVDRWDLAFPTGITLEYVTRRKWNNFLALREFIQNALDIEEKMYGYDGISINVWEDELGIHVADRGPGLPREAWLIGGSSKECWERGRFGEGMKMGAAQFLREDVTPYIFTVNPKTKNPEVYKAVAVPPTGLVVVVWGVPSMTTTYGYGTEVILHKARLDREFLEIMIFQNFIKRRPKTIIISRKNFVAPYCHVLRPAFLLNTPNALWVADIYVNTVNAVTGYPSIFSYNLWYVELDPNRVSLSPEGLTSFCTQAAKIHTPDTIKILLDRIIDFEKLRIRSGLFETELVNWAYASTEVLEAVADYMKQKNMVWHDNAFHIQTYSYLLNKLVLLVEKNNMKSLFIRAEKAETALKKKAEIESRTVKEGEVPLEDLTLYERGIYNACVQIAKIVNVPKLRNIVVTIGMTAEGRATEDTIYLHRKILSDPMLAISTIIHELAHIKRPYGMLPDVSAEFEESLTYTAGRIVSDLISYAIENPLTIQRSIMKGAFAADIGKWHMPITSIMEAFEKYVPKDLKKLIPTIEKRVNIRNYVLSHVPLLLIISLSSPYGAHIESVAEPSGIILATVKTDRESLQALYKAYKELLRELLDRCIEYRGSYWMIGFMYQYESDTYRPIFVYNPETKSVIEVT